MTTAIAQSWALKNAIAAVVIAAAAAIFFNVMSRLPLAAGDKRAQ
jgi:hypothetical protein